MENDWADESSDESSDEEDVQSEADQDAHLEKNEVFRQWLRHGPRRCSTVTNRKIR